MSSNKHSCNVDADECLKLLKQGRDVWNRWREDNPQLVPSLVGMNLADYELSDFNLSRVNFNGAYLAGAVMLNADLCDADLQRVDLSDTRMVGTRLAGANLSAANLLDSDLTDAVLCKAKLIESNLAHAKLVRANLKETTLNLARFVNADLEECDLSSAFSYGAHFSSTNLSNATIFNAQLYWSDFHRTKLIGAKLYHTVLHGSNLSEAELRCAELVDCDLKYVNLCSTNLENADIRACCVFGISAWNVKLDAASQRELLITKDGEPAITVDDLEVAQFIYMMLNNRKLRNIIDTVTSKVVLILGRFTAPRKAVLEAIAASLTNYNLIPVIFDFSQPFQRDVDETVSLLARMAKFVIADLTAAKSVAQELKDIVHNLPSVPVQPILHRKSSEYGMFSHYKKYQCVLDTVLYSNKGDIVRKLPEVLSAVESKLSSQQ